LLDDGAHFFHGSESAKEILSEKKSKKNCWKKFPERRRTTCIEETLKEQDYE